MHSSAMLNAKRFFDNYGPKFADGAIVVDIGSMDVNGSLRDVCPTRFQYVGIDFESGKNVDLVMRDPYIVPIHDQKVDMVTASSVFEHSEMFWVLFLDIMRTLKPHGLFYLNVPSNGAFHRHPVDCWRFYPDAAEALVTWANRNGMNVSFLESWFSKKGDDGSEWNDFVAVFVKNDSFATTYPNRMVYNMVDGKHKWKIQAGDVYNGRFHGQGRNTILDLQDFPAGGQPPRPQA